MPLEDIQLAVVIAWAIVCSVIAVALATSVSSWILFVGSVVLPALVMVRMWQPFPRTVAVKVRDPRE